MTKQKVYVNDKSFSELGLKVGDVVTLAARRILYNGKPEGGGSTDSAYYLSHASVNDGGKESWEIDYEEEIQRRVRLKETRTGEYTLQLELWSTLPEVFKGMSFRC